LVKGHPGLTLSAKGYSMTRSMTNILVDQWTGRRSAALDLLEIVGFSLLTAVLGQIRVPLPFTPVPMTGQTLGVLLAGVVLGSRRGGLSQALYLVLGAAGLHFAGGSLVGPTAGYLWMFPLAALLVGALVERGAARRTWTLAAALVAATVLILAGGALWLSVSLNVSARQAILLGVAPFWLGDLVKIGLVAMLVPSLLRRSHGLA
jgi:biotin transport system substrate-specific component